ncbi:34374_t:CDS:2 [Gigaspora margarita]|uniref:34374_t:CDS:1 n=1 Tax=Gigaspora margarita TaxID=4874 RepID=A0ABM8VXG9_GIGMA|nr:34374_t:CDS:2 [Gigaspora margarita]
MITESANIRTLNNMWHSISCKDIKSKVLEAYKAAFEKVTSC